MYGGVGLRDIMSQEFVYTFKTTTRTTTRTEIIMNQSRMQDENDNDNKNINYHELVMNVRLIHKKREEDYLLRGLIVLLKEDKRGRERTPEDSRGWQRIIVAVKKSAALERSPINIGYSLQVLFVLQREDLRVFRSTPLHLFASRRSCL